MPLIIFISAIYAEEFYQLKAFESGGIDLITKPLASEILRGKVRNFLKIYDYKQRISAQNEALAQINRQLQDEIIERKQADAALQMSERRLRKISENFPNSDLSLIDKDLRVVYTGGQEFTKQNLAPDVFLGMSVEGVFSAYGDTALSTITVQDRNTLLWTIYKRIAPCWLIYWPP